MGSAFQQLLHSNPRSLSCTKFDKWTKFSIGDSKFNTSVLGKQWRGVYFGSSLRVRRSDNKPADRKYGKAQWRCCDVSASEISVSPVELVGASAKPEDSLLPSLSRSVVSVDIGELQATKSLEKAGIGILEPDFHSEASSLNNLAATSKAPELQNSEKSIPAAEERVAPEELVQSLGIQNEKNLLQQMWDIVKFAGPALGIWLSGPMMSLIDTAVVGNCSSLELAALGPGTVFCDQLCYVFMFLSVATSNLIATSLAKQDEAAAAHHLSRLLFVALACGITMLLFTGACSSWLLKAFVGPQNIGLVPAANSYVQIRSLAWPAALIGMVAQSASLGMQDSWGPLKILAIASSVNLCGDILLCTFLGYGIAGAAWATMLSQYIGGYLMLRSLDKKGYNALDLRIPSIKELAHMVQIAAPVLLTMLSKVCFYAFITFLSTTLGAVTLAAHQVMIGIYSTCTVSGEPLCQTAQSFMPGLIEGKSKNILKAKMLLRSLLLIGVLCGTFLACIAISFPWVFPQVFTNDVGVINQVFLRFLKSISIFFSLKLGIAVQMRAVTVPFLCGLVITPPLLSLEGTLLASRDFNFLSCSMATCFLGGATILLAVKRMGFGLPGFWWTLACFQSARFLASYLRLKSDKSVLRDSPISRLHAKNA